MSGSPVPGMSRPDGVEDKDALKDFHHVLAVQAASQQIAEFQAMVKSTEVAKSRLEELQKGSASQTALSGPPDAGLDQALDAARSQMQTFTAGFSEAQKSGLKEISKRLARAASDLEQEENKLRQSLQAAGAGGGEVAARSEDLSRALAEFSSQELALGREMSIILANGQDLAFTLPTVRSRASIGDQAVGITVSGTLSQVAATGDQRTFKLELVADLSDLQQNVTELLRARLDRSSDCGERVSVRRATLAPAEPAGVLTLRLHLERWFCPRSSGHTVANELAESDADVEMKLTPAVEKSALGLASQVSRIDGSGMMADELRSGDLGTELRDKATQSILSILQAGADFKMLPPVLESGATIQRAKFRDGVAGVLYVVFGGEIQLSNEQASQLATQLNQALSARGATQ